MFTIYCKDKFGYPYRSGLYRTEKQAIKAAAKLREAGCYDVVVSAWPT